MKCVLNDSEGCPKLFPHNSFAGNRLTIKDITIDPLVAKLNQYMKITKIFIITANK